MNVFAVMGLLDLKKHAKLESIRSLRQWLTSHCKDAAVKAQFEQVLNAPRTACLISERFINIPPQLAVPMYQTIVAPPKGKAAIAGFDYIIMVCKQFAMPDAADEASDDQHRKKRRRQQREWHFRHPEEEEFVKAATSQFMFRVQPNAPGEQGPEDLTHARVALVVPVKAFRKAVERISSEFSAPVDFSH
eukprot:m.144782 g.144782  ORF g.144782 m.144782 type:complete len:190 (-) comp10071_c2_seq1:2650-3219(-)